MCVRGNEGGGGNEETHLLLNFTNRRNLAWPTTYTHTLLWLRTKRQKKLKPQTVINLLHVDPFTYLTSNTHTYPYTLLGGHHPLSAPQAGCIKPHCIPFQLGPAQSELSTQWLLCQSVHAWRWPKPSPSGKPFVTVPCAHQLCPPSILSFHPSLYVLQSLWNLSTILWQRNGEAWIGAILTRWWMWVLLVCCCSLFFKVCRLNKHCFV